MVQFYVIFRILLVRTRKRKQDRISNPDFAVKTLMLSDDALKHNDRGPLGYIYLIISELC